MAESTWYVRDKGRVMGPFNQAQFEKLRSSGRLNRGSEVSTDQQKWVNVTSLASTSEAASTRETASSAAPSQPVAPAASQPGSPTLANWYYARGKERTGPVSYPDLLHLVVKGTIGADTPVWNESMADWAAASLVPELRGHFPGSAETSRTADPGLGSITIAVENESSTSRASAKNQPPRRAGLFDLTFKCYHSGWIIPVIWTVTLAWLGFIILNLIGAAFFPRAVNGFWADFGDSIGSSSFETRRVLAALFVSLFIGFLGLIARALLEYLHMQLTMARKMRVVNERDEVIV